jgi:murein DD-endopeptidase MepM/ murein hydrolase activator NlpD
MNSNRKYNKDKNYSFVLLTLLLWSIFFNPFYSLAKENELVSYKVIKGDSWWGISQKYNVSLDLLFSYNQIKEKDILTVGQIIKIPQNNSQNTDYITHVVQKGETLWSITQEFKIAVETIIEINDLEKEDLLSVGQKLEIPALGGGISEPNLKSEPKVINHTVVKGDTLWNISKEYDVKMNSIVLANNLKEISRLPVGQQLKIPITKADVAKVEGNKPETVKEIIYYVKKGETLWSISQKYNVKLESIMAANKITNASKISAGKRLKIPKVSVTLQESSNFNCRWPIQGKITSAYGLRRLSKRKEFHSGIDISNSLGNSILAAESGTVTYTGYMRSYGNVIILKHKGGYSTVYAHNLVNLVKKGQYIKKGSVIAQVGRTGNATGPHLHFEVRLDGDPLNPSLYLT